MTARGRARACARATRPGASERERRETYLLPGDAAEQGMLAIRAYLPLPAAPRIVDLGTGPGVLGQRARRIFPGSEIVGVEVRADEAHGAARHYDRMIVADYLRADPGRARLVVTNPPFSLAVPTVQHALARVLVPGGWLVMFARKTWGESSEAAELLHLRPPAEQWLVHRRLSLDGAATDNCCHVWWVWRRGAPARASWTTRLLPALPSASCGWTVPPGGERITPEPLDRIYWPEEEAP